MAGYQFAHLEVYSRKALVKPGDKKAKKWTTKDIFAEAKREASACGHVENPSPPVVVFGQSLEDTEREHDRRCDEAVSTLKNGKTRKLRSTQNTLLTVVLSHPDETYTGDVREWEKLSIQWLKDQYGDQLKTVIRHDDEKHEHLHAYIIPAGLDAASMHPGNARKVESKGAGKSKYDANRAYRDGLKAWQDSYYESVGIKCGLARTGPKLERLSRKAWLARQDACERFADITKDVEAYQETVKAEVAKQWAETSLAGKISFARKTGEKADVQARAMKMSEKSRKRSLESVAVAESRLSDEVRGRQRAERESGILRTEVRKLCAEVQDKEHTIAQIEYALSENIRALDSKAKETGLEADYHALSGACRTVGEVRKADKTAFKWLWSEVRTIILDVQKRAPNMLKKAFGWVLAKKKPEPALKPPAVATAQAPSPRVEPAPRAPSPAPSFNM